MATTRRATYPARRPARPASNLCTLAVLLLRFTLDLIDLPLRALAWGLVRLCLVIEAAIVALADLEFAQPVTTPLTPAEAWEAYDHSAAAAPELTNGARR